MKHTNTNRTLDSLFTDIFRSTTSSREVGNVVLSDTNDISWTNTTGDPVSVKQQEAFVSQLGGDLANANTLVTQAMSDVANNAANVANVANSVTASNANVANVQANVANVRANVANVQANVANAISLANTAATTAANALSVANLAQAAAAGLVSASIAAPTSPPTGAIWFPLDNNGNVIGMKLWNGSAWTSYVVMADQFVSPGSLGTVSIANSAVTAPIVAANAITVNAIAANAVTANAISANAITAGKIAANSVTAVAVAANSVAAGNIQAGAVVANSIAAGAVTANAIGANAVTAGKIAANAVTANAIAANAVTANTIQGNAINGKTITGSVIRSSATPATTGGTQQDAQGFHAYDAAGVETAHIDGAMNRLLGELISGDIHINVINGDSTRASNILLSDPNGVVDTESELYNTPRLSVWRSTVSSGGEITVNLSTGFNSSNEQAYLSLSRETSQATLGVYTSSGQAQLFLSPNYVGIGCSNPAAMLGDTGWISTGVVWGNGFTEYSGSGWGALRYRVKNGWCIVRGAYQRSSWNAGEVPFNIPAPFRPAAGVRGTGIDMGTDGNASANISGTGAMAFTCIWPIQ